jgi:hypothetical protein
MEYIKELIAILSGIIALLTAWVGYRTVVNKQSNYISIDPSLKYYANPTVDAKKTNGVSP